MVIDISSINKAFIINTILLRDLMILLTYIGKQPQTSSDS